jgi:transposase-like protein
LRFFTAHVGRGGQSIRRGRARRRHTPEQIIRKLREADRLLGEGHEVAFVAKQLGCPEQTLHRWRREYGGLKADDAEAAEGARRRGLGRAEPTAPIPDARSTHRSRVKLNKADPASRS